MTSLGHPLAASLLLLLLASSVVKATLNLTLQYELREDSIPGTVIGNIRKILPLFMLAVCFPCSILCCLSVLKLQRNLNYQSTFCFVF